MSQVGHIDLEDPVRAHRSTVLFGVLALGLVLTQQACADSPAAMPTAEGAKVDSGKTDTKVDGGKTGTKGDGGKADTNGGGGKADTTGIAVNQILAGKRQIAIKPLPSSESILAIDDRGRLNPTDGEAEHGLFVLTPVGDRYLIKTAKAGAGGEPSCIGIKTNGSSSLTVEAAACDTRRAGQLFTITARKVNDRDGRPTYAISNESAFLQVFGRSGLIAEELGDAPLTTTYAFVDNGPSALPALD